MDKLRVGVIGLGMGRGHAKRYKEHANVDLVALADLNEALLRERAAEFGVSQTYTNAEEMLAKEKLDIVSIATPNKFHKPLTIQALGPAAMCYARNPWP